MFKAFLSAVWKTVKYEILFLWETVKLWFTENVTRFKGWWKRRGEEIDEEEYPW
jgi:hypothetical protein